MTSPNPIDSREFRNALGCFATGVTVITALDGQGNALGITVNSFSAVSLEPPLVLWSLARNAERFAAFEAASNFTVNVLSAGGAELSNRFATKGEYKIDRAGTVPTKLGPPAFAAALAVFECETHAKYDGGDHVIIVGRVRELNYARDAAAMEPLLFYRGRYGVVGPLKA